MLNLLVLQLVVSGCTAPGPQTNLPAEDSGTTNPPTTKPDDTKPSVSGDTSEPADTGEKGTCPSPTGQVVVSGLILKDAEWISACTYLLRGGVYVGSSDPVPEAERVVLTIQPGTLILGEEASNGFLSINRGGRIMAEGTADEPIVFTSSLAPGNRSRGDWGAVVLNGNATINGCDFEFYNEGDFCTGAAPAGLGSYGGVTDDDSSGVLTYVRIEFSGALLAPQFHPGGLGLNGVGSGTTIDHVQIHMGHEDGVDVVGGAVNLKHIVVTQMGDEGVDWTDGWTGNAQFLVVQGPPDSLGDNGIEGDNNGEDNNYIPRSNPTLSNVTLIGSPNNAASDFGILLREGTVATIWNAQVVGFNDACLDIDGAATFTEGITKGGISLRNVLLDCATNLQEDAGEPLTGKELSKWFIEQAGNGLGFSDIDAAANALNPTAPDFTSALIGGSVPPNLFFDDTDIVGAVGAGNDWTVGWTSYPLD